jgi:hypothetical protein
MNYLPQTFARCLEKRLSLSQVMQKEPIDGVYECKGCLRSIPNSPLHPESTTQGDLIEPWPDFTPCQNFVALRWGSPVSDEALHKMVMDEIPSLDFGPRKSVMQDLELGMIGAAVKCVHQQQGWTMDGFDYAAKNRRTLMYHTFEHEMKRRKNELPTPRLRPL